MEKELLEKMAEKVHDAWWEEKKKQGYHHPDDCPEKTHDDHISTIPQTCDCPDCPKCHADMKPYAELDEKTKELDRVMVITFEKHLKELGYAIGRDYTDKVVGFD